MEENDTESSENPTIHTGGQGNTGAGSGGTAGFSFSDPIKRMTFNKGNTNAEKAFFHGMKAVRRLAEEEQYTEAAEIAGILSEWWQEDDE